MDGVSVTAMQKLRRERGASTPFHCAAYIVLHCMHFLQLLPLSLSPAVLLTTRAVVRRRVMCGLRLAALIVTVVALAE